MSATEYGWSTPREAGLPAEPPPAEPVVPARGWDTRALRDLAAASLILTSVALSLIAATAADPRAGLAVLAAWLLAAGLALGWA